MSSPLVLPAVADGEFEVRRPYTPSRRGWWIASNAAAGAVVAVGIVLTASWLARLSDVRLPFSVPRQHLQWPMVATLWLSLLLGWGARDALRDRRIRRDAELLRLDAAGLRVAGDDTLAAPWDKVTAIVDGRSDDQAHEPAGRMRLRFGSTSVILPLDCLGLTGPEATDLLRTASDGTCDPLRSATGRPARLWPV